MQTLLQIAVDKLASEFFSLDLTFHDYKVGEQVGKTSFFPGGKDEDIIVCIFKGNKIHEPFHRQDFFFFNFAYKNSYKAASSKFNNVITINENECYIGQPFSGYALRANYEKPCTIIGILIRKNAFFREYLPTLASDNNLFKFFLDPQTNRFSDEFIHLSFGENSAVRNLLELMVMEYADRNENTQKILKSLTLALFMYTARQYHIENDKNENISLAEQLVEHIMNSSDTITLKEVAGHFGYHQNYISALLRKETGKTFTQIVKEKRMNKAMLLLKGSDLSVEEISAMLGYSDESNFYKAFKEYFGKTPREFASQ